MRYYKKENLYNTPLYDRVLFFITLLLLGLFYTTEHRLFEQYMICQKHHLSFNIKILNGKMNIKIFNVYFN